MNIAEEIAGKMITAADNQQRVYDAGRKVEQAVTDAIITRSNVGHYYNDRITAVGSHSFNYCTSLLSLNLPNVTATNTSCFSSCTKLTEAHLPKLKDLNGQALFSGSSVLEFVDYGSGNVVQPNTFLNCKALTTIVIRHTSRVPTLLNINAFSGTPFAQGGTGGKIYAPSAWLEQYKTATNWSVLFGYGTVELVALEGSEYE